ncbi:MAG: CPBP family intramembrane metalloprotease [Chloroflexi bacterium]|nr:CPBP family intramembrane metalloprotease [Chloroflexota bacterium]MCL5275159.1 CPBP family intramembrane metalloprotease [Chloroflexota bacterium]
MIDYRPNLASTTNALHRTISRMPWWLEFTLIIGICFGQLLYHSSQSLFIDVRSVTRDLSDQTAVVNGVFDILVVCLTLGLLKLRGWNVSDYLPIKPTWGGLFTAILLLAGYRVISILAFLFLSSVNGGELAGMTVNSQLSPLGVFAMSVNIAFIEELIVLGYIMHALKDKGAFYAITVSTFIRLAIHLYGGPVELAVILPMGILFGIVYRRNRNLWPLMVAHALFSMIALA